MEYLVLNTTTNEVENVILWDGQSPWDPGDGYAALKRSDYPEAPHIGWKIIDGNWVAPPPGFSRPWPFSDA